MRFSVVASTLEVASSRIRMRGCGDQRAGDRHALALPAAEREAALADQRVEPVGQLLEQLGEPGALGRLGDLLLARVRAGVGDVVAEASPRTGTRRRTPRPPRGAATPAPRRARPRRPPARRPRSRRRGAGSASRAWSCRSRSGRRSRRCGPAPRRGRCRAAPAPRRRSRSSRCAAPRARRPAAAASRQAPRSSCGSRSSSSNTRAPLATARCAIPSAMPSQRIGPVSIRT